VLVFCMKILGFSIMVGKMHSVPFNWQRWQGLSFPHFSFELAHATQAWATLANCGDEFEGFFASLLSL
jgi:hypothetical protein